jgi:molybdate transport system ATP-binding protein
MRLDMDIHLVRGNFRLDVQLAVADSATGIFGHSGSGKSTLLRCIAGLERPAAGRIELDGRVLFDSSRRIWIPPHRRGIGMVFQEPRLFPHWSVQANVKAGKQRNGRRPCSEEQIIELLQIASILHRPVQDLSGGEKQRVSLARALMIHPRLLLMDEPLSGLDAHLKARILPFLDRIHRELDIPTLFVSHDLSEILRLSNQLILMKDGHVAAHGSLDDVIGNNAMAELIQENELNQIIDYQLHGRNAQLRKHHERKLPD